MDLNKLQIKTDGQLGKNMEDNSVETKDISVYFRNIEEKLVSHIKNADAVFGAVAWLTSDIILDEMSKLKNVSIVVQKEDFLRPDLGASDNWKNVLRKKYDSLHCELTRSCFSTMINSLSYLGDPSINPVRCIGNSNKDKKPAFPRMHNKFLVFAKVEKLGNKKPTIAPYSVWTGSFNLTKNATNSLENALYITVPEIVNSYFNEYSQIFAMSEPLDWESEWVAPEFRIGS